jgi:hypothetical protein
MHTPKPSTVTATMKDTLGRNNRKLADKQCSNCGSTFRPRQSTSKYCSRPCLWVNNGGHNKKHEHEKAWQLDSKGYLITTMYESGKSRRVRKHRFVMERFLGRRLRRNEVVHHINGNRQDNSIGNLVLMTPETHNRLRKLPKAKGGTHDHPSRCNHPRHPVDLDTGAGMA